MLSNSNQDASPIILEALQQVLEAIPSKMKGPSPSLKCLLKASPWSQLISQYTQRNPRGSDLILETPLTVMGRSQIPATPSRLLLDVQLTPNPKFLQSLHICRV